MMMRGPCPSCPPLTKERQQCLSCPPATKGRPLSLAGSSTSSPQYSGYVVSCLGGGVDKFLDFSAYFRGPPGSAEIYFAYMAPMHRFKYPQIEPHQALETPMMHSFLKKNGCALPCQLTQDFGLAVPAILL